MLEVISQEKVYALNPEQFDWDIVEVKEGQFHILKNNKSYLATILEADAQHKSFVIQINKRQYTVQVKDKFDQLVEELGLEDMTQAGIEDLKAPMPGLVLEILVEPGQLVQKGDSLLILEAMKMENVIKATGDALVKHIAVEQGTPVEKSQLLIEFDQPE